MAISLGLNGLASAQSQHTSTLTTLRADSIRTANGVKTEFTVHVSPAQGNSRATGVVSILDGAHEIGSAVLNAEGDATIESSALAAGTHTVSARYGGSDTLAASLSADSQVTPNAASDATTETTGPISFTATASPTALNVVQGQAVSTTITLTPLNGFSNYVSLSCTGLPADSTCVFLPVSVFVSGTKATTSVLSIETYGSTGPDALLKRHSSLVFAFVFPGMLGLVGLGLRKRGAAWRMFGLLLLTVAGLGGISGCSQRYQYLNRSPEASSGTPLGSTKITIEAQAVSGVNVTTQLISNVVLTVQAPSS